jgi:hypothetical protein
LRTGEHGQTTLAVGANLGIVQYRTGHPADAVPILSSIRTEFIHTLGEDSPQAQIVAFYLASAQSDLHNYTEAATLVGHLQPVQLSGAEPRDDWDARLKTLRGTIQLGEGHQAQ